MTKGLLPVQKRVKTSFLHSTITAQDITANRSHIQQRDINHKFLKVLGQGKLYMSRVIQNLQGDLYIKLKTSFV